MIWSLKKVPDLSDEQFAKWRKLLEERAGICLNDHQRTFLQTHVSMRMREMGFESFSDYYNCVLDGLAGKLEWSLLIDGLVVQETQFFRHKDSFDYVKSYLNQHLPAQKGSDKTFDVWSVGCSSGEEPYSLAMLIHDTYETLGTDAKYAISCTDISRAALSMARSGVYNGRKLQLVGKKYTERYFEALDNNQFHISPSLADRICFSQGNVVNIKEMPKVKVDIIYCQNLLVYFRRLLREQIMNAFVERLKPGGIIVIGLGEVVNWTHPKVKRVSMDMVQAYVYN